MIVRHAGLNMLSCLDQILLLINHDVSSRVLLKGSLASRYRSNPDIANAINKLQQHLFVITSQTNDTLGIVTHHFHYVVHTTRRIQTSVNEITQKHERVALF